MLYQRRASPLHAARAGVVAAYGLALVALALSFEHPLALAVVAIAIAGAGTLAGVGRPLGRAALLSAPLVALIAAVQPLVHHEGLTVLLRLGELGPLGRMDVTAEDLAYGAVLGVRALLAILGSALVAAAVDPDEVLRLFARVSIRSALTAALAVRLVPVLARDGRRLAAAQRCRPDAAPRPSTADRLGIVRAVATGALDRSIDVAATLELRGYGLTGGRRSRPQGRPWSRHDLAFAASALGLLAVALAARLEGVASFAAYPTVSMPAGAPEIVLCLAIIVLALAPFADRRGIA